MQCMDFEVVKLLINIFQVNYPDPFFLATNKKYIGKRSISNRDKSRRER
jgi:hypothetical protein